ncbi:hypothetical protein EJ02DRAFT_417523 [Clathrospora elynae]|uniref:Uncharacterized protein n=1 Tax=Clathrospora elynae TaxID=706981 RepID=A0A6A5T4Z9_9PLEO|nr:hypothetical protein EJ02DRAFT_417523 [Clathrospora elynae]
MSGLEVFAAVSAVISAFHGGSELLKHVKQKRRTRKARDLAQQEWEEKQLQESLVSGEQQIDLRYKQDLRELGDFMRVGDVTARDRLFHIALVLQAEIIKSLQVAATNEFCVLNLRMLHEASITNRNETFVTLDELKQRIYVTRPMARQLKGTLDRARPRHASASGQTIQTNDYSPLNSIPDDYIPAAVTLPSQGDPSNSRHALTDYLRAKPTSNSSAPSPPAHTPVQASNISFSAALEELFRSRGTEDRATIMQDIEEMISSYKGLDVNKEPSELHGYNQYGEDYPARQDTLSMLQGGYYEQEVRGQDRDPQHMFKNPPPTVHSVRHNMESTTASQNMFDAQHEQRFYHQQYATTSPYPHMQIQTPQPRWSDASASSSAQSNTASINRNNSNSSLGSNPNSPRFSSYYPAQHEYSSLPPSSTSHNAPYQQHNENRRALSPHSATYAIPEDRYTPPPIPPLSPLRTASQTNALPSASPRNDAAVNSPPTQREDAGSPIPIPWPGSKQHRDSPPIAEYTPPQHYSIPIEEEAVAVKRLSQPQYYLTPQIACAASSTYSGNSKRTTKPSGFAAIADAVTALGTSRATAHLRHASITPSVASTNSSGSGSIGILPGHRRRSTIYSDTIQSGPAGGEKMMNGRPNKDNHYWGFCKGAWAVREDPKKGIAVRTQPSGYYNSKQIWSCTSCTFTGDVFTVPHPTKKKKSIEIVDPRVKISMAGIRYRWIFLAKSHVKKKAGDGSSDDNFGCILCSAEGNVTGVYGGVETLMNHIALTHVADMSEMTRKKVNCVLGRVAGINEDFDINVPIFAQVEQELEG